VRGVDVQLQRRSRFAELLAEKPPPHPQRTGRLRAAIAATTISVGFWVMGLGEISPSPKTFTITYLWSLRTKMRALRRSPPSTGGTWP